MTPILLYWLKANLAIAILFLVYYCLLRKEKFFRLNIIYCCHQLDLPAFSFFNYLVLNRAQHPPAEPTFHPINTAFFVACGHPGSRWLICSRHPKLKFAFI